MHKAERGKVKKVPVPLTILNWAIAFLAKTSVSVYNEVREVMKLPHISYIYKKTAEMVSTLGDKAYAINIDTICEIGKRANCEKWTAHQRTGVLAQDSANLNAIIEHDYVSNTLVGMDESHRLGDLTHMFQVMAQKVRDSQEDESDNSCGEILKQVSFALCESGNSRSSLDYWPILVGLLDEHRWVEADPLSLTGSSSLGRRPSPADSLA